MTWVDLKQWPDDSWTLEVPNRDSGLTKVFHLGRLNKEQAIRETRMRGHNDIRCWNKDVVAAILKDGVAVPPDVADRGLLL